MLSLGFITEVTSLCPTSAGASEAVEQSQPSHEVQQAAAHGGADRQLRAMVLRNLAALMPEGQEDAALSMFIKALTLLPVRMHFMLRVVGCAC